MTEFPDEATVTLWEAAAHAARTATAQDAGPGAADALGPDGHRSLSQLTDLLAETVGRRAAEAAVTQWFLTDRPISDCAWFHRLAPGVRVVDRFGSRTGVVRAPVGEVEEGAEMADAGFMRRHISWFGDEPGTEPELMRTVQLAVADDTPTSP